METGFILIAYGCAGAAIAVSLWHGTSAVWRGMGVVRYWLTKELARGDLRALGAASRGYVFDLDNDQIKRLRARGYLRRALLGGFAVTLKGRVALTVRWFIGTDRLAAQ